MRVPDDPLFVAMTLEEVLEETQRSKRTVTRWVRDGRLPAYKLNNEWVFVRRDVLKVEAETAHRRCQPGARVVAKYVRENTVNGRFNPLRFGDADAG